MPKHLATPRTSSPQIKNERENIGSERHSVSSHYAGEVSAESREAPAEVHADLTMIDAEPMLVATEVKEANQRPSLKIKVRNKTPRKSARPEKKPKVKAERPKKEKRPKTPRPPKAPRQSRQSKPRASQGSLAPSGRLDFQSFMANLAPVDIVAILGFAFLAGWTLWFSIECFMMPVIFPAVISLIACIVFVVCFILLVRARMVGPYAPQAKVDSLYEAQCSIRVIDGIADDKDSDVKACTVTCTRDNLILNFKAWQNVVPWSEVEVVDSVGARGLTLKIPRDKVRIVVRMTFSTTEDRLAVEQICRRYNQQGKDDSENVNV